MLPQPERANFYEVAVLTEDKRIDCYPAAFAEGIERCEAIFVELEAEPEDQLKLISLRTNYMHNSTLANMTALKRGKHALNPLHMHPGDAVARGLANGDVARIYNRFGEIFVPIEYDDTLRPGVVALTHGYGGRAPSLRHVTAAQGVNVNRLAPHGPGSFDVLSNMAHLNGVPVFVDACVLDT